MLDRIKELLQAEADAITGIPLSDSLVHAVDMIVQCRGKIFTTGIGKAGYVARKAASTFSTTGAPAVFLHPADASHGDVGALTENDILFAFSNSGRTREIIETIEHGKHLGLKSVISITSKADSPIGQMSCVALEIGEIKEPCPFGFTPTASTAAMLALSDALALAALDKRGFKKEDFAARHHGGYLGQKSRS